MTQRRWSLLWMVAGGLATVLFVYLLATDRSEERPLWRMVVHAVLVGYFAFSTWRAYRSWQRPRSTPRTVTRGEGGPVEDDERGRRRRH
jgi:hypothetical protein